MKKIYLKSLAGFFLFSPAMSPAQNIGIGTSSPAVRLHVLSGQNHTARFDGPDQMFISLFEDNTYRGYLGSYSGAATDVDFGTGAGNSTGKLHLTIQASPRLTIQPNGNVGIGTQTPSRKLEVNGSLGITGGLYLNGASGLAGQVLVSNGSSSPMWQDAAISNNTRFGILFQKVGTASTMDVLSTYYNLNPANVAINASSIVINKTGLYRFNGYMSGLVQGASITDLPEMTCDVNLSGGNTYQYDLMQWKHLPKRTVVNSNYYTAEHYSFDMHIIAPTTISFAMSFLANGTITHQEKHIRVFGYLLSE